MKRNKQSKRTMRRRNTTAPDPMKGFGNSRYARKVQRRNQMYGPGCCANALSTSWSAAERATIATMIANR